MADWMMEGFVGYGRLDAPLWLLGMEERCRDDADAASRLAVLPTLPVVASVSETHRLFGYVTIPEGVAVWDVARQVCQACQLNENVGETAGDVLLSELLPLPRPSNKADCWPAAYLVRFRDYAAYERALLLPRAHRMARLIQQHKPRVVLVHGRRYHAAVEDALMETSARLEVPLLQLENKRARILKQGDTAIVFVDNFGRAAAWSSLAKAALATLVAVLWRGEVPDAIASPAPHQQIETLLAGMFHHRAGNVLPQQVATLLPGFTLHASRGAMAALTRTPSFRRWATQVSPSLGGRTPIEACMERDLADLCNESARYARLHKRYGGRTAAELHAAVSAAHEQIVAWARGVERDD